MATDVILPVLGMAQDTGKVVQWLKAEGEQVAKGEPIVEVETDKATVELESPADGVLTRLAATAGDDVPVGQVIAQILALSEVAQAKVMPLVQLPVVPVHEVRDVPRTLENQRTYVSSMPPSKLASRVADEYNVDLSLVTPTGKRIQKADVLSYLQNQQQTSTPTQKSRMTTASPKARRLAAEQGLSLPAIKGTGPEGAVLAADVLAAVKVSNSISPQEKMTALEGAVQTERDAPGTNGSNGLPLSTTWRIMAERTTQSWTSVPHFFLAREVRANRFIAWRESMLKRSSDKKVTYTDLLIRIVAVALRAHPYLNATWSEGTIVLQKEINIGLAVALAKGLVVPVLPQVDELTLHEIAQQRQDKVSRAQAGKLRPQDLQGGTFTISNLGMYGVDTFNAIINAPQAAILAVGRIVERVVPVNGQPSVQPTMILTLSCDHRVVDGARGAQFMTMIAELIEEPLGLVE